MPCGTMSELVCTLSPTEIKDGDATNNVTPEALVITAEYAENIAITPDTDEKFAGKSI